MLSGRYGRNRNNGPEMLLLAQGGCIVIRTKSGTGGAGKKFSRATPHKVGLKSRTAVLVGTIGGCEWCLEVGIGGQKYDTQKFMFYYKKLIFEIKVKW